MKINESLCLSHQIHATLQSDLVHAFHDDFPAKRIEELASKLMPGCRERTFTPVNTILTMLASAVQEDKSLQNALGIFTGIYERASNAAFAAEEDRLSRAKLLDSQRKKSAGRPRKYLPKLPKHYAQKLSSSTAAYSTARRKLDVRLALEAYEISADFGGLDNESWHGLKTFMSDGTYLQLQDEADIRSHYRSNSGRPSDPPQGLLQVIVRQGSGQISQFELGSCRESELALVAPMIRKLEAGSLLLADDLYNSYYHFSLLRSRGCHIIVPGKRKRIYKVKKEIGAGDQIVEISKGNRPDYVSMQEWEGVPKNIEMRRIEYAYPTKKGLEEAVIYTTLLDEKISSAEIVAKYSMRWDIEISIREVKEIMDIRVLRSKSRDMLLKELTIALTAYNMVRKIMARSAGAAGFSPQESIVQECYPFGKPILMDKKGRVYSRWSTGRYGSADEADKRAHNT